MRETKREKETGKEESWSKGVVGSYRMGVTRTYLVVFCKFCIFKLEVSSITYILHTVCFTNFSSTQTAMFKAKITPVWVCASGIWISSFKNLKSPAVVNPSQWIHSILAFDFQNYVSTTWCKRQNQRFHMHAVKWERIMKMGGSWIINVWKILKPLILKFPHRQHSSRESGIP